MKAKRWSRTVQGTIVGLVVVTAGALGVVAGGPLAGAQAAVAAVERVSVSSYGGQGDGNSWFAFISADGRYVCFMSEAPGLTDGDTNGLRDSILHDRQTGATERVSVSSTGHEGNGASYAGPVSLDGRYVAFTSEATNLEPAVKYAEALLRDRASNTVTLLTPAYDGSPSNGRNYADDMTPDGRFVAITAFSDALVQGDTNGVGDMVLLDRQSGSMELASLSSDGSPGDGASGAGAVSDDGRVVAFQSDATNLVPGDTNGATDIFVRNLDAGTTERVSVSSAGVQGDGSSYGVNISPDGRYVVFYSHSSNLVPSDTNGDANDVFIHDLTTGVTELVSV
jgi:Tol biopolymer transport system component